MNRDSAWIGLREMSITYVQEIFHNFFRRVGTIDEKQLIMLHSLSQKLATVVLCFIQSDNSLYVPFLENITVLIRSVARSLSRFSPVNRTHKRCELPRYDPINISVLDSFVVFIFLDIEGLEVVPLLLDAML
jgi:hypothetical protein